MLDTYLYLKEIDFPAIQRSTLETLQVNLGYRCNLSCKHCHVNAGPKRTEMMGEEVIQSIIELLQQGLIKTLDLTGGAPELNPHFKALVKAAAKLGVRVIDRCNLTILEEQDHSELSQFLADHQVEVVASMPCYLTENVDAQRGKGTFAASIKALQNLNQLGYGQQDSGKFLNLVYNPQGAQLPPPQVGLEVDYKTHLYDNYGVEFNQLLTIANLPIHRFGSMLLSTETFDDYMEVLQDSHKDENLSTVMCRSLISVDWQGKLYDCDFNQMLKLPMKKINGDLMQLNDLYDNNILDLPITVAGHCYGCTAGQGSSCGGALS